MSDILDLNEDLNLRQLELRVNTLCLIFIFLESCAQNSNLIAKHYDDNKMKAPDFASLEDVVGFDINAIVAAHDYKTPLLDPNSNIKHHTCKAVWKAIQKITLCIGTFVCSIHDDLGTEIPKRKLYETKWFIHELKSLMNVLRSYYC